MTKLAEGGFNKVFRLVMDNGSVAIARIPNPNAGPAFKTTASEVATMDFVRTILGIPVPEVFAWSAEADNPVGAEYIVMEEAVGTQLGELWRNMELTSKVQIVNEVIAVEKKLLSLSFTRYGNIYFAQNAFAGCEKAELAGTVSRSQREEVGARFVVGPVVDRDFWNKERATMNIDRGPWTSSQDYLKAIAKREISWISRYAKPKPTTNLFAAYEAQSSTDTHISLYRKFLDSAPYLLPNKQELIRPTIWHWDLHAPNLFVQGGKITSLIDWQGAWAGPLFLQARHPRLVDYNGKVMLKLPDNYEVLEDPNEKARIRDQVERSIVLHMYEAGTAKVNPVLHEILHLKHGRTRRETVDFAADTWDGSIIRFRECLIRIARFVYPSSLNQEVPLIRTDYSHWNDFNSEVPCPISFSDEELKAHYENADGWNEKADFWASLDGFVHRDGWTSNDNYEQALEMFAELREQGLKHLDGEELAVFEEQTRWAMR